MRDGRDSWCRACCAKKAAEYRAKNLDRVKASAKATREKYKAEYNAKSKEWRDANRDKCLERAKAWSQANPERRAAIRKKWRDTNIEKAREIERASQLKHRNSVLARKKAYYEANRAKYTAYSQKRRAALLKATPGWADFEKIEAIFQECAEITELLGFPHHVDHVIPLISPIVCGLHVENNLRIIDHVSNRKKGNKLVADSYEELFKE